MLLLENNGLRLTIQEEIGRIMHLRVLPYGDGLLWDNKGEKTNTWINYGGDRVWTSQQALWPFIHGFPTVDSSVEGHAWTVKEANANDVVIVSPVSQYQSVQVERKIRILPDAAGAAIENSLTQVSFSPFPAHLWSITQVPKASFYLLDVSQCPGPGRSYVNLKSFGKKPDWAVESRNGDYLTVTSDAEHMEKIGTLGKWIAAVYEDYVFLQLIHYDPTACYPDGASVEIWIAADHVELETLSPSCHLQPGSSRTDTVIWRILNRPPELDIDALVRQFNDIAACHCW